jgi:hypothetical protein
MAGSQTKAAGLTWKRWRNNHGNWTQWHLVVNGRTLCSQPAKSGEQAKQRPEQNSCVRCAAKQRWMTK